MASDKTLTQTVPSNSAVITHEALGSSSSPHLVQFRTTPFQIETEITGHVIAHLNLSMTPAQTGPGWLRLSNRKVEELHPKHREYLPRREYLSTGVLPVEPGQVYPVDIEIWPTNVVIEAGGCVVFEVAPGDTQGSLVAGTASIRALKHRTTSFCLSSRRRSELSNAALLVNSGFFISRVGMNTGSKA